MNPVTNYTADEFLDCCLICGSHCFREVYNKGVFYNKIGELREVVSVICEGCGVIFNNPRVKYEDLLTFYESLSDYMIDHKSITELISKPESGKTKQRIDILSDYLKINIDVLEIGGGNLNFAASLAKSRPDINIYELEPSLKGEYKPLDNLTLVKGFIDSRNEYPHGKDEFDIVVALHVLEHQCDPVTFLRSLKNITKKDGILFLELPNLYTPFYFTKEIDLFFRAVHLFNFNKNSLDLALRKSGYVPILYGNVKPSVIQVVAKRQDKEVDVNEIVAISKNEIDVTKKFISRWNIYSKLKCRFPNSYIVNLYAKISWILFKSKLF